MAVQPNGPILPKNHVSVQRFNQTVKLKRKYTKRALDILHLLGQGGYCADAAVKELKCSKGLVSHWKDHFIEVGALTLDPKSDGGGKYYNLTSFGSQLIALCEAGRVAGPVYVLEDYAFKFILERDALKDSPIEWRRYGQPKNWARLGVKFSGVTVVLNKGKVPTVEIHTGKLQDFDPYNLCVLAGEVVGRVKAELAARHGVVLSERGQPVKKPIWQVFTSDAALYPEVGNLKIDLGDNQTVTRDRSPPFNEWHREYDNVETAIADAQKNKLLVDFKHRLESLERQVSLSRQEHARLIEAITEDIRQTSELRKLLLNKKPEEEAPQTALSLPNWAEYSR